jgi:hypothetical protein
MTEFAGNPLRKGTDGCRPPNVETLSVKKDAPASNELYYTVVLNFFSEE